MDIPILIICYNNYKYVENTLLQIKKINPKYYENIIVINNTSCCLDTKIYLQTLDVPVMTIENNGPWIDEHRNRYLYDNMPDKYIISDPDLELNGDLPTNFIEVLSELSDIYNTSKIGFALDISDYDKMYQSSIYYTNETIYDCEKKFWEKKIIDDKYELFDADLDTTFVLINKKNISTGKSIRVGGDFTAKHIPWYVNNKIYNFYENYKANMNTTKISTVTKVILPYIEETFMKVEKGGEMFLLDKNAHIEQWNSNVFEILDKYLDINKIFIEIGGCNGFTAMYASRKSKHVYSVDRMPIVAEKNLRNNCKNNYSVISDNMTIDGIITIFEIDPADISIVLINIDGDEMMDEVYYMNQTYKVPVYILYNNAEKLLGC